MLRPIPSILPAGKELILALLVTALCSITGWAQFTAAIQGTVTDTTGAVVPGATVKITSLETGKTLEVQTSAEGFYRISGLSRCSSANTLK